MFVNKYLIKPAYTLFALGFVCLTNAQAGSISKVEAMAHSCFACHGVNGRGSGKIPELNDLDKEDIVESLIGFKSGEEKATIMHHLSTGYSDKEIEMLAKYFADLKNK